MFNMYWVMNLFWAAFLGTSESTIPSLMYGQPAYVEHKVLLEKMSRAGYFADDPEKKAKDMPLEYCEKATSDAPEDNTGQMITM